MHKNDPKQESDQATLARVKKEMDEPRMAESTREEDVNQTTRQKLEKLPQSNVVKEFRTVVQQGMLPKEKNYGKVNKVSS
jgi:hypothetical protein